MVGAGIFVYIKVIKKKKGLQDRESVPLQTLEGPTERKKSKLHSGIESDTGAEDKGKNTEPYYKTPIPSHKVAPATQDVILEDPKEALNSIENINLNQQIRTSNNNNVS